MDGVMADVETQFINWIEREKGIRLQVEDLNGNNEKIDLPVRSLIRKFVYTPGFFRTLPLMPGAVEAVQTLMEEFEVYIVSAAMEFPQSLKEKYEWLQEHFPFIGWENIVFCGDKSIINTDYMIDDHCRNLDACKGKTLLFHAYHNGNVTHHTRVNNWKEVLEFLKAEATI